MCDIYMKDNIDSKLMEFGICVFVVEEYWVDIFGKNVGSNCWFGLIDVFNLVEFDIKMEFLSEEWKKRYF